MTTEQAAELIEDGLELLIVADSLYLVNHVVPGTNRRCTTPIAAGKVSRCEHGFQFVRQCDLDEIRARKAPPV